MLTQVWESTSKYFPAIVLAGFAAAGFAIIWFSSPWGIGVGYDSIFYLSAADNLLSGLGMSRLDGYGNIIPLTHFPPLYSLVIAGGSFITGFDTDFTARILAAVLFGLLVALTGWILYRYTRSIFACLLGSAAVLFSPVLLDVSLMAMSELLYLVGLLLMIQFINQYLLDGRMVDLILSASLTALLVLTRYVGTTAVAFGALSLLLFRRISLMKKFKEMVLFAVISLVPVLVFYLRNWVLTGSMSNRVLSYHPPTVVQLEKGVSTILSWLLPARIDTSLRLIVLGLFFFSLLALIGLYYTRRNRSPVSKVEHRGAMQFVLLLFMYAVIYVSMVLLSLTFFDASTPLNDRILSPLYLIGILAGLIAFWNSELSENYILLKWSVVILALLFVGINMLRGYDVVRDMRENGRGFSGKKWRSSETIAAVRQLPAGKLIFSNEAFAIYYLTGTSANWIPENFDPVKEQVDDNYGQRINSIREEILAEDGALVVFDSIRQHNVYAPVEELSRGLILWNRGSDGEVYISP